MMEKFGLVNSMVGKRFPFFLCNHNFKKDNYFLYEVYSPGIDEYCTPYISLKNIASKTPFVKYDSNSKKELVVFDILDSFNSKIIKNCRNEWVSDLVNQKTDDCCCTTIDSKNPNEPFPWINLANTDDEEAQVRLICELRDYIRWINYNFSDGKKVDILISPDKFAIFGIKSDGEDKIKLNFENLFSTEDITLSTPLKVKNLDQINSTFCRQSWKKDGKGISSFNRFIKEREYKALLQNS